MRKYNYWAANFFDLILGIGMIVLICYTLTMIFSKIICFFILLITIYIYSVFWANIYYFYEEKLLIYYPTRIFMKRKKYYPYILVSNVKYINKDSKASSPTISIELHKNIEKKMYYPENSFTVHSFKKRKAILIFLRNKGISIVIESQLDKDRSILRND